MIRAFAPNISVLLRSPFSCSGWGRERCQASAGLSSTPWKHNVNKGFAQVLALCQLEPPSPAPPRYFWSAVLYLQGEPSPGDPSCARWVSQSCGMGTAQFKCIQSSQNLLSVFFPGVHITKVHALFQQCVDLTGTCPPQFCSLVQ